MPTAAAAIINDIHKVSHAQDRAFAELGGAGSSLRQLTQLEDTAKQFRELYSDFGTAAQPVRIPA
jgi:hypothetical protein